MLIQRKRSSTLLSLLVAIVIVISILDIAGAATHRLVVQNVEVSPKVAMFGETVRVKANIRNTEKNATICDVTAFVGESVVEEFEGITIPPKDSYSLLFTINTSSLPEGEYSVDIVVEEASSEEAIFDLGTIAVEQTTPEQTTGEQVSSAGSNMLYLLAVFPLGATVAFIVWKRRRNGMQEEKLPEKLLPNLLNEVLNFEENVEKGAEQNKLSSDDKNYIR